MVYFGKADTLQRIELVTEQFIQHNIAVITSAIFKKRIPYQFILPIPLHINNLQQSGKLSKNL